MEGCSHLTIAGVPVDRINSQYANADRHQNRKDTHKQYLTLNRLKYYYTSYCTFSVIHDDYNPPFLS
mgnify:CR=1 FL=1